MGDFSPELGSRLGHGNHWAQTGQWVPVDNSGAGLTFVVGFASWTRVGNILHVFLNCSYPSTANTNNSEIAGLPPFFSGIPPLVSGPEDVVNIATAQPTTASLTTGASGFLVIRFRNPAGNTRLTNAALSGLTPAVLLTTIIK